MTLRLVVLFIAGAAVARLANWFAWWLVQMQRPAGMIDSRSISREQFSAVTPHTMAWIPVLGAWSARQSSAHHAGPSGWRPLIVELVTGLGIAGLYLWEVAWWELVRVQAPPNFVPDEGDLVALHAQFTSHVVLIALMLVASLVDIDEQTIPDLVTVPGTLLGLLIATLVPYSLLPVYELQNGLGEVGYLNLASPNPLPPWLAPHPTAGWLFVAIVCFLLWCLALLPWRTRSRRGWRHAVQLSLMRVRRDPVSVVVVACAVVGSGAIALVWLRGGDSWVGLITALVGMAAGGGLIWAVRIAASWALAREAMGFGDVTLMAMIGTFLGWQAGPMVFFLAPLAGLGVGLAQWFAYRDNVIPYGPFLCLATLGVILQWGAIWDWAQPLFDVTWLVPAVIVVCLLMLAVLLRLWRFVGGTMVSGN